MTPEADSLGEPPALPWRLATFTRAGMLAACLLLALTGGHRVAGVSWVAGLALAAVVTSRWRPGPGTGRALRLAEAILTAVGVVWTGGSGSPLLPYLVAAPFDAGISDALEPALATAGAAAVVLAVGRAIADHHDHLSRYAGAAAEWLLLAVLLALAGRWLSRLTRPALAGPQDSYVAAYRLLAQLRTVARQLSVGLDTLTLAEGLLSRIAQETNFDRAAVFVQSARGERLLPLTERGEPLSPTGWRVELTKTDAYAEAWVSQQPRVVNGQLSGRAAGSALVVPLHIGLRSFGLVVMETGRVGGYPPDVVRTVVPLVDEAALRLGTALLFDELRELATVEERRRVAREIHDGIAQELASLGYLIDNLAAEARGRALEQPLRDVRQELTRILSELRLSIFDLRSDVEQHGGLGAALSDYVRAVGTRSPITVHVSLDEGPTRLPADVEAELLRIAQEAITNARKHARASNLWVDCQIDPPRARLRIEDDGEGLRPGRRWSFGMEIMRERAERLRAQLSIEPRQPSGTRVEVVLGGAVEPAAVGERPDAAQ